MLTRLTRSALVGAVVVAATSTPSAAAAETVFFQNCVTPGVCGFVEAFFTSTILTVRVQNRDATVGSALFDVQIIFANALNPAALGSAFTVTANADASRATSIGTTPGNAWSFSGVGGSNLLDLVAFMNVFIEGSAASPFRAVVGDPDNGTWVTEKGYVEFSADLAAVAGITGNTISQMGFCTDQGCIAGQVVATPEPATLTLVASGLAGIAAARRRRNKKV